MLCANCVMRLVSRIALVSPERAKQIEAILFRMAQSGQLRGRVTETQLIGLLEQVCQRSFPPVDKCADIALQDGGRGSRKDYNEEIYNCGG